MIAAEAIGGVLEPDLQEGVFQSQRKTLVARNACRTENPEAWLVRALRLECLRHQRREIRRRQRAVDGAALELLAGPEDRVAMDLGLRFDLRRLVRRLPARQRALILLRFELGLTSAEAARQLGYQPASLKKTTTRCLHALRRKLEGEL